MIDTLLMTMMSLSKTDGLRLSVLSWLGGKPRLARPALRLTFTSLISVVSISSCKSLKIVKNKMLVYVINDSLP
jgi:ribosomal protein L36